MFLRNLKSLRRVCFNSRANFAEAKLDKITDPKGETKKPAGDIRTVTLFPGDGIGPEITEAVLKIFSQVKAPVEWEFHEIHTKAATAEGDLISQLSLDSVKRNKYGLKGPFTTPIGKGFRSLNVTLRKKLQLYANVRPAITIKGAKCLYDNVNLVTIRENTEGEYSGLEHEVVPGVVENLKIISRKACQDIAEYAFDYARRNKRKKVTACHKAGIMKLGDGLFLNTCKEVAAKYPEITFYDEQVDTVCMRLAADPSAFDVMVMPNLYGDIVSDLCSGLVGGLGLTSSGNIGKDCSIFEAVHGSAPDIAGKNMANPTALLLSGVMMLNHMGLNESGDRIQNAIFQVIGEGKYITRDIGGKSGTNDYVKAIVDKL